MSDSALVVLAAVAANGLLTGASLDQSVKQLPARHRIGARAFARYSQATDLANGVAWYAVLGVGTALLTLAAAANALSIRPGPAATAALAIAAAATIGHSAATTRAAPVNFSQRKAGDDEAALAAIFDRFARWQTLRVSCQVITLAALCWALALLEG